MPARTPRITVFIPAHDAMPHLAHTVASIQAQTHGEFQVLVINDGSTDGTGEYLDSIRDPRFRIVHQSNRGLAATANRGVAMIDTEFVARLDSDDIALPRLLETQLKFMDEHPAVAVAGARMGYVYKDQRQFHLRVGRRKISPGFMPPMSNPPFWNPATDGQTICNSGTLIRPCAFLQVGGYRDLVPAEDVDLWYRLSDAGFQLACLPEVLVLTRIRSSSVSSLALDLQHLYTHFVVKCHHCRRAGQPEPLLEEHLRNNPMTGTESKAVLFRQRTRRAMAAALSGDWLRGSLLLMEAALRHPRSIVSKIRSRI